MDVLPWNLRELEFDHDAAFRATWAVDELIARVEWAADNRARVANDILCSCQGPFVGHLDDQIRGAGTDAERVVDGLRRLRAAIEEAREAALYEDVRRQLARTEWEADRAFAAQIEARAARALAGPGSSGAGLAGAGLAAVPALPN